MKKLFLALLLFVTVYSCSGVDYDYNSIEAAKAEYEWLKSNIKGRWEEYPKPFEGTIEYGYACFNDKTVETFDIFGYNGIHPYELKYKNGLIYLIVENTEYWVVDINEKDKTLVLRNAGNLKKVGD